MLVDALPIPGSVGGLHGVLPVSAFRSKQENIGQPAVERQPKRPALGGSQVPPTLVAVAHGTGVGDNVAPAIGSRPARAD
jgi:hypothetical protein